MGDALNVAGNVATGGGLGMAQRASGKKGQAPPPPDYKGAAEATARGNRPNQSGPFGSVNWTTGPDGRDSQTTSFSGPLAGLSNTLQGQAASAFGTPLDNGAQARQHAEDAIYGRETSRLDPMFAQRETGLRAQLANQGLDPTSAAYGKSVDTFERGRNDAYSSALQQAIMGGGQEASRQQQMDLQSRFAPLQGLQGLQGLLQQPGFNAGPNYLGAAQMGGQYGLDKTQMDNQFWSDLIGGGSKAGAAALAAG
jgi:hypothetical protein